MTQKNKIGNHLVKWGSITSWTAIQHYGITRLAEYIRQFRNEGLDIETTYEKAKNGNTYARYVLKN